MKKRVNWRKYSKETKKEVTSTYLLQTAVSSCCYCMGSNVAYKFIDNFDFIT